jgi:hypothetical protein
LKPTHDRANDRLPHAPAFAQLIVELRTELSHALSQDGVQNIDADDLPADVKKSFDAMVEAEAAFKADLEQLLKKEGHMPEHKYLLMSRKGKRLGVAYASTPGGKGRPESLKFKTK